MQLLNRKEFCAIENIYEYDQSFIHVSRFDIYKQKEYKDTKENISIVKADHKYQIIIASLSWALLLFSLRTN